MPTRKLLALAILCGLAWSQTALTTIQDTLFTADGSRFNGTVTIQWSTFDATNIGMIVQQSKTVQVVNGNLYVQLVPNAGAQPPANVYTVQYQSGGSQQFTESWTVGVSAQPLTVAEVRIGSVTVSTSSASANAQTPIPESSVVGLVDDLTQRPMKGVAFGTNGVAIVDDSGALETAVGQVGDCVMVDGTTGPCGGIPPTFADNETPGGIVDGSNNTFTLVNIPSGTSLILFRNGLFMTAGSDYTLTASTLLFPPGTIPQPLDVLTAFYRVDPSVAGNIGAITGPASQVHPAAAAQVICSAAGATTRVSTSASLGACDVPIGGLQSGDRIEIRFTLAHTGTASGFDLLVNWGSTAILSRHGGTQDAAVAGRAEAAITLNGAQVSVESWGTILAFLPAIVNSPFQNGLKIDFRADVSTPGSDTITLTNYTVLRYPSH